MAAQSYTRFSESISYDTGRQLFNNCTHIRREQEVLNPFHKFTVYNSGGYKAEGDSWGPSGANHPSLGFSYPAELVWSPDEYQARKHELWERVRPTMTTGFSALNFIHELKDFKSLFRVAIDKLQKWRSLLQSIGPGGGRIRQSQLNNLVPDARGLYDPEKSLRYNLHRLHLQYAFAWAPLIGDLKKVTKAMRSFHKRYNALVRGARKPIERKAAVKPSSSVIQQSQYNHSGGGGQKHTFLHTFTDSPKLSLTTRFNYLIPELGEELRLRALLDTFGVNFDLSILWNAIPFSFVVDWFSNMGNYLEQFKVEQVHIPVHFKLIGYSMKYRVQSKSEAYYGTQLSPILVRTGRYSYYKRWKEQYIPPLPISGGLPSLYQATLALSLITVIRNRGVTPTS